MPVTMDSRKRAALAVGAGLTAAVLAGCGSTATDGDRAATASTTTITTTAECDRDRDMTAAVRSAIAETPAPSGMTWQPNGSPVPEPCRTLDYSTTTVQMATVSSPEAILLFHNGEFVGLASKCLLPLRNVQHDGDNTVVATYRFAREGESNAGASGTATLRYTWDGDRVVTDGSFPAEISYIQGCGGAAAPTGSTPSSTITEVAPADFATPGAAGYYRWKYGTGKECAASPAGIWCSVTFPPGTPDVRNDVFTGPPNSIHLTAAGTRATITEGGPPGAQTLPVNSRITIDGLSCTAVTDGIDCDGPDGGFTFIDGTLTRRGTELAPTPS
ncbi:LppP/LprE family lipoprotein [Gordonia phosphorivorans]|uniref:LppP/LprE family lipoprotein n=1 Tax=Gordonia phosphorivorans TaxID=1056982 RepID=A0ABV6HCJ8_9ACTN